MYVYCDYDVRILTTCSCDVRTFRRRTSPTDVRIIRHVRIFLAYAFYSTDVRILCYVRIYDVCHPVTYVLSVVRVLLTYAFTDVRHSATYVLWKSRSRDYAVKIRIRDYGSDEEDPLGPIRP